MTQVWGGGKERGTPWGFQPFHFFFSLFPFVYPPSSIKQSSSSSSPHSFLPCLSSPETSVMRTGSTSRVGHCFACVLADWLACSLAYLSTCLLVVSLYHTGFKWHPGPSWRRRVRAHAMHVGEKGKCEVHVHDDIRRQSRIDGQGCRGFCMRC